MKPISLPFRAKGTLGGDRSTTSVEPDYLEKINERRERVISAAIAIEDTIVDAIAGTLFKEVKDRKEIVISSILESDWCTFGAKRKLLNVAIDNFDLTSGKKKSDLDKYLSKVMKYRNAFAHGGYVNRSGIYKLRYFDTKVIEQDLDDEFWSKIEESFMGAYQILNEIEIIILENA